MYIIIFLWYSPKSVGSKNADETYSLEVVTGEEGKILFFYIGWVWFLFTFFLVFDGMACNRKMEKDILRKTVEKDSDDDEPKLKNDDAMKSNNNDGVDQNDNEVKFTLMSIADGSSRSPSPVTWTNEQTHSLEDELFGEEAAAGSENGEAWDILEDSASDYGSESECSVTTIE